MRVAVVARAVFSLHGVGGLERHVRSLTRHLVKRGCEVTLFVPPVKDAEAVCEGARLVQVESRPFPWPRRPGFVILDRSTNYLVWSVSAAKRVSQETFDVVHAESAAAFGYAFEHGRAPLVMHVHGLEEFKGPWMKRAAYAPLRWATRYAARGATRVLVPDASCFDEVRSLLSVGPPRAVLSRDAIDLEEIDRAIPPEVRARVLERLAIPEPATVLLSVGRLEPNKGFDVLVDALAGLRDASWIWVLVGSGASEARLRDKVAKARLEGRVRWAGLVADDELHALYDRCRIFVHPTLYEGSSLVTLEAMAHRKPVVATSVGGIPDKVVDGESGFLVAPGDSGALAGAIRRALESHESHLEAFGVRGRARVENEFSLTRKAEDLVALYAGFS